MRSLYKFAAVIFIAVLTIIIALPGCRGRHSDNKEYAEKEKEEHGGGEGVEENEEYDGPDKAVELEFRKTKDPALNRVPTERLLTALSSTMTSRIDGAAFTSAYGSWTERGPSSDVAGPSGNSRPNGDVTAGRVRAILVDAGDATGKTVFIGGVDGGLWKTTDITTSPANWILVNDFLSNLAVSDICQDPSNKNIMYFCTGESYYNGDAVRGVGVFKSTDHGVTWNLLPSTSAYTSCTRILCDATGNVYLSTNGSGLRRSLNGGTSWTDITPTGMSTRICDLELSSTGRMHVVGGIFSTQSYRYTDAPATVATGGWSAPATAFPSYAMRAEIAVSGNTLYACPANASYQVPTIYVSIDGGANWAATGGQPTSGWASGQGWYSLSVVINPADANQCIVGGLDNYKTTNGGNTWTKISTWVGTTGQYVHADQHKAVWYDNGNKLLFGSDGGIFYTSDGGTTIRDRNIGLRLKQFYSVAIHPTLTNYFLAGAQDNGSHALNGAGLTTSTEVTGGDGAFVHIDQDEPQYQFTSYVYNQYRRSSNSGVSWTSVNLNTTTGQFINPTDYDNTANIMYCGDVAGSYRRWTNPQTGSTSSAVDITSLGGNSISAVTVSPYTSNRVYFGTENDVASTKLCYVDGANSILSGSAGTDISAGLPTNVYTSCIATGTTDNNLMVCYSNYGVQQIWVSTNGGTSWTNIDGNLPDMPVRWCMFAPGDNTKAIIATETGVWLTQAINGSSTSWLSSPTFPPVRTDMLQYRPADKMVVAATHGRGLWSQTSYSILPLNNFNLRGRWSGNTAELNWTYEDLPLGSRFDVETSSDAVHYAAVGSVAKGQSSDYSFKYNPSGNLYYRIKGIENTGSVKFSNVVRLFRSGSSGNGALQIVKLYPNPVKDNLSIAFNAPAKGTANYAITTASGQVVWSKKEELAFSGNYNITESVAALKPGSYIFTVVMSGAKASQAFIKQ